jgi:hypothetical protein
VNVDQINLQLTINETNAVLLALAKLPYETVAQLIEKIRTQSLPQVPADQRNEDRKERLQRDLLDHVANDE